jgi:hypothetical protein
MILTITIDDKELPLVMRAYGLGQEIADKKMDEKALETELINRIQERLYSSIFCQKQTDAAATVVKSTELTTELSSVAVVQGQSEKFKP